MSRKSWTLILVCVATFMLLLDITIVNVALPSIQEDLDASFSSLQWVVDAYALTLASFLLVAGSFGDRLGRRRVFVIGLGIFTVASLLCGVAHNATVLNVFRGLQGVGAAAMFATALALIAQEFEGRERAKAIGIWGATVGGAVAIGPLIGGLLTDGLGWEWIFFVNIPIGGAAILLTQTKLANVAATDYFPVDWAGVTTFSLALFGLIFGLIRGNAEGWGSLPIVASLGASVALLIAFFVIESRREHAMLDLSLFRVSSFRGASIVAWSLSATMFSLFLYLTLYLQDVVGLTPLQAGACFLPLSLLSFLVAPISANLSHRIPVQRLMGVGLLLVAGGLLLMRGVEPGDEWTTLLPGFIVAGIGVGMTNPLIAEVALGVVEPARAGHGLGDQLDLPPGRDLDRRRRARRDLPGPDPQPARLDPGRIPRRVRRCDRGRSDRPGRRPGAARASGPGPGDRRVGLHLRLQRDPPDRRRRRGDRRHPRLDLDPPHATSSRWATRWTPRAPAPAPGSTEPETAPAG